MQAVTAILILGAIASLVAWVVLLLLEHGIRPMQSMVHFVRRLPWSGRLAVLPLFIALVVYGSVKNHSNERGEMSNEIGGELVSNRVERVERDELGFNAEAQSRGDAQRGEDGDFYRAGESGFDGIVGNAVISEDWLKFGGYEDWIYVGPGAWSFRYGSNFVERLAVFSSGKIRILGNGGGDAILSLIGVPVSIAPMSNWGSLGGAESCFWHAETPSNTLLLAWQNALLNRQSNSLVNIQAELFPSGKMRITHDLSGEAATEYVPAPQLPPHVPLAEVKGRFADGNTNAYYYADVVVEKGPAIVTVRCGAETALGDYAVVACPGETNRLPFLIGPKYEVESEAAFSHFGVADEEVLQTNLADRIVGLQWPVEISFEEGYAESGKMFEMSVMPDFLGGNVWIGSSRGRSRAVGCVCGCDVGTNGVVRISENCNCNPCTISGIYGYEGYSEEFEFNYYPEEDGEEEPADPEEPVEPPEEPKPSVSVWFDKSAVIFEDEYENSPGVVVPRRSTRVKLTCCAYGGERGGNFTVDLSGMGELKLVSGTPPSSRPLAPYETVTFEAEYEAEKASSQKDGTVARVKITENETNQVFNDDDNITVVKVTISPMKIARDNMLPGRHKLGVCEVVSCRQEPNMPLVTWDAEHGSFHQEENSCYYHCPLYATINPITVRIGDVEFIPSISVVEPQNIVVGDTAIKDYGVHPGMSGYIGMVLDLYVSPFDVSFEYIEVEEVPNEMGVHTGYFALSYFSNIWYHTSGNGAGVWIGVEEDNHYAKDLAAYTKSIPKVYLTGLEGENILGWYYGYLSWNVPFGWRKKQTVHNDVLPHKQFAEGTRQEFVLESNGNLTIFKLGSWVSRSTNEVIMIYGAEQ